MRNSIKVLAVLVFILAILMFGATANHLTAQTLPKPTDKVLKDTVIKTVTYKLYQGSRGGKYIIRTSKTGTSYKQYIKKSA